MRIQATARNQAHAFEAAPDETILDAGLRAGIALPYECGSGTCGTCRARLTAGDVEDRWPEAPGRRLLKAETGELLMCQTVARGDCAMDIPVKVEAMPEGACVPGGCRGVVRDWTALTHDVVQFDLELDRPLTFEAGQFVLLGVEGIAGRRAYSMVNCDRPAARLRFVVKKKPQGRVSEWLFAPGATGASLSVFGPLGSAIFTPDVDRNLLCVAGGSGIAGLMSILARAGEAGHFERRRGRVYFGVRTERDLFFLDELAALRRLSAGALEITLALSEAEPSHALRAAHPDLGFDTGFVHEVAARHMTEWVEDVRAYLAGPPPMVDAMIRVLLREARLSPRDIRYDKFS